VILSGGMAVAVEMDNTGSVPAVRSEIVALIEHVLSDRPGNWRVLIVGSRANDLWEMKITGPNAFERSYTLEGTAGEHEPPAIAVIVARMVPAKKP
jgi:hypothetical protein